MPNGKTHFITGALVGAAVNVLVQSTQIAMDYDRPFDWGEFFLCTGAGAFVAGRDAFHRVPNSLQSLRRILAAGLVAWAISGKHTLKFSRATRLALWVFGMSYLGHIALDCATPKRINFI